MEEDENSAQAYRVKSTSAAVANKLKQIPFHSRVLKHVLEPVQLNIVPEGIECQRTERNVGSHPPLPPVQCAELGYRDQSCGGSACGGNLKSMSAYGGRI